MQGISWLAEDLLASQEGLCSMELVYLLYAQKKCAKEDVKNLFQPYDQAS
jgi:hypothetical protein